MNNSNYPWYLTWPAIIVAFLFFWPLALVLIYLRSKNSKSDIFSATSNKKLYIVLGGILILMGINSFSGSVFMGVFLIVGGVAMVYYANTLARKASRNKSYIDLIVNQGETSIDKIASSLNVKYDVAVNELKTMQTLGILKGTAINEQTHSISIEKVSNTVNEISSLVSTATEAIMGAASTDSASTKKTIQTACPGCGAKYTGIEGTTITCDYCDTSFILK